jgi:C1A family cysteine protease
MIDVIVDLRAQFGPARDQKQRPTCMAFAASDAHAAARGKPEFLSTEFAHFHAVRRRQPFDPHSGVSFRLMAQTISKDGQPPEGAWPYLAALPTKLADWKPPVPCAPIFRRRYQMEPAAIGRICQHLQNAQAVVMTMNISTSFFRPAEGFVGPASEPAVNTHAVVAVGYGKRAQSLVVLVRNSWGEAWGLQGHAWIAAEYLRPRLLKIGTADRKEELS